MNGHPHYRCTRCAATCSLDELVWCCQRCGGLFDLDGHVPALPAEPPEWAGGAAGIGRYAGTLPVAVPETLSMGEGQTPLVRLTDRPGVAVKLELLMPTGSFKDRGAVLLVALAMQAGARRVLVDSSGNAGASLAAYAARAGIPCDVYVPAATSTAKLAQLDAYGATVHRVDGSRAATAEAAAEALSSPGVLYASHVYNPLFHHGTKTYVYELWAILGGALPSVLVLPVGNGTLVLGASLACQELLAQGRIARAPRIVGVQSAACAPLVAEVHPGGIAAPTSTAPTIAEGIAIADPPRRAQILAAIRSTDGDLVAVTDEQVRAAQRDLGRQGFYVEPTAAVCMAALQAGLLPPTSADPSTAVDLVLPLCGSGSKADPPPSDRRRRLER